MFINYLFFLDDFTSVVAVAVVVVVVVVVVVAVAVVVVVVVVVVVAVAVVCQTTTFFQWLITRLVNLSPPLGSCW